MDIFGRTIGEIEEKVVSFFNSAFNIVGYPCILVIDNLGEIFGPGLDGKAAAQTKPTEERGSHVLARALSTFLTMIDFSASKLGFRRSEVALVCTANTILNTILDTSLARFDDVFVLQPPVYEERRHAVMSFVGHDEAAIHYFLQEPFKQSERILADLATATVGLSYAELSQSCREAIMMKEKGTIGYRSVGHVGDLASDSEINIIGTLASVKGAMQSFAPASLRGGSVDDFVDMRVISSVDLIDPLRGNPNACPLYGHSNELAWQEIESQIIPLCKTKELNLLFNGNDSDVYGSLRGGLLLTGPAGSGKTSLARQACAFASSLLPSIKLLEVNCTSIIHKEVGSSEKAIHRLFECARSAAPCVVILDDVALIASVRGHDNTTEGTMDRVLSTLLTELDGVEQDLAAVSEDCAGIVVIGITQAVEWVDPTLLRPGRLGKIVTLEMPDRETRRLIASRALHFAFANASNEMLPAVTKLANLVADRTAGMTGAGVIAMCDDARRICLARYMTKGDSIPSETELLPAMPEVIVSSTTGNNKRSMTLQHGSPFELLGIT